MVYLGFLRETEIEVEVDDLGVGCGEIDCPECAGTGNWGAFLPEPQDWFDCVQCKGTGRWHVSV
ncbi:hypothetical protein [Xanthomonas phage BsXeu269p/3]|nr:hypothetical protein [Xanthomonas phage BsXeu269p/3]